MENEMENGTRTARPADDVLRTAPNREAAAAIRSRARTNARVLRELKPEARAHAFAVAGIEDMERLRRVQEAVAKVPEGGDWAEARGQIASALGDPGKAKDRAENVLRTNCFQAYSAARYRSQMADRDVFPYLKYVTMGDGRVRDSHARLDGTVLPKGDPFWETHYPPWDWGCRCVAVELTEGMAKSEAEEGEATVRDADWSRRYRAEHKDADRSREYQHRPGSLTVALDEVALRRGADGRTSLRYGIDDLRAFNAKMEKATVERTLPDGSTETVTVREWMWEPVREKAESRLREAGAKDGKEHALVLDRDTGEILGKERAGDGHSVVPDWNAARGHDVAVYHNHPGVLPDLSPEDVLASLAHGATEVGSVSGGGAEMRLRFLVGNNPELAGTIRGFRDRIRAARTIGERLRAAEEWDEWIKLHGTKSGTGLFRIKGTAL